MKLIALQPDTVWVSRYGDWRNIRKIHKFDVEFTCPNKIPLQFCSPKDFRRWIWQMGAERKIEV